MFSYPFNSNAHNLGTGVNSPLDEKQRTAMHMAVDGGDYAAIDKLLRLGANINAQDNEGHTPLFEAIRKQDLTMVDYLITRGARMNLADKQGHTPLEYAITVDCARDFIEQLRNRGAPLNRAIEEDRNILHIAAQSGRADLVEYLIKNGIDVNMRDGSGNTPLSLATQGGHHDAMRALLRAGADPVLRDNNIMTPLHYAAERGDETAADILLGEESVRRTINKYKNLNRGFTPLMSAVDSNYPAIAEKIARVGGDVNMLDHQDRNCLFIAVESGSVDCIQKMIDLGAETGKSRSCITNKSYITHWIHAEHFTEIALLLHRAGVNLDLQDGSGYTILHKVADQRDIAKVKTLLDLGANPNITNEFGKRPIDIVMDDFTYSYNEQHDDIVLALLHHGASANISPDATMRQAPLHLAAQQGRVKTVKILLQNRAIVDQRDRQGAGMTPLMSAAYSGHFAAGEALLAAGANPRLKDNLDRTLLHLAAEGGSSDFVSHLAKVVKLDLDAKDYDGATALITACKMERKDIALQLIELGTNIKIYDNRGYTALHHAADRNTSDLMEAITDTQKNINLNIPSRDEGYTPLHIASLNGYLNTVSLLLEKGADPLRAAKNGLLPIHYALISGQNTVFMHLLSVMRQKNAAPDQLRDQNGWTLLHYAATLDITEPAAQLIAAGCNITARDNEGHTPLHIAVRAGKKDLVNYLVTEKGADLSARNNAGQNALEIAAHMEQTEIAEILVHLTLQQQQAKTAAKPKPPAP